ncbi:hypothetical protein BgiBS90_000557, partial [Biomphalaria glabrata]
MTPCSGCLGYVITRMLIKVHRVPLSVDYQSPAEVDKAYSGRPGCESQRDLLLDVVQSWWLDLAVLGA